jgi:hypothetical protein
LITLGALVAHGDIAATKSSKLQKAWHAKEIMDELLKLHPEFYPYPMRQGAHNHRILDAVDPSPLPRDELLNLYGKAGDYLHRGSVKKLIS